jgi:hypothetical protein
MRAALEVNVIKEGVKDKNEPVDVLSKKWIIELKVQEAVYILTPRQSLVAHDGSLRPLRCPPVRDVLSPWDEHRAQGSNERGIRSSHS